MTTKTAIDRQELIEMSNTIKFLIQDIVTRMADCDESALSYVNVSGLDLRTHLNAYIIRNLESISIRFTHDDSILTVHDAVLFGKLCGRRDRLADLDYNVLVRTHREAHALQKRAEERYFAINKTKGATT